MKAKSRARYIIASLALAVLIMALVCLFVGASRMSFSDGVAILSSLHDLNQALCLGAKFVLLRDGAVCYAGDESVLTSEVIGDIFDIQSRIITIDGKKVILGGKYYEES